MISGFRDTGAWEDEGQHLQSVYQPAKFYGGPGRFGLRKEAHLTEESKLVSDENRIRLFSDWQKHWDINKPFLLEKSPPNLIMTRFLQEMFPDSYFLIITRHPVAVSFATQKFVGGRASIHSMLRHWLVCHEIFWRDSRHLKNLYILRYEDFVKDPSLYLQNIYSFLGIDGYNTDLEVRANINDRYFKKWEQYNNSVIKKPYTNFLKLKFERSVNRFGYSLHDLKTTKAENAYF
jgi:hypothetical protein